MKKLVYPLLFLLSLSAYSQKIHDEFMPTFIGDKEAFLSSKTGEFVYRAHDETDVTAMYTTDSGTVVYEDRKEHSVKKGETLSSIAKKQGVSVSDIKTQNKLKSNNLSIGQKLKIVKKWVVPSSKPVVNKPEGKIIARLAPGQTPGNMTPPDLPPDAMPGSTINLVVENADGVQPKQNVDTKIEETVENVEENISDDGTITHTVKGGETLFSIARKYKVSIADLKKDNELALNNVSVGQKLKVKVYNPAVFSQQGSRSVPVSSKPIEKLEVVNITKNETNAVENIDEEIVEEVIKTKAEVEEVLEEKEVVLDEKTEAVTSSEDEKFKVDAAKEDAKEELTKALIEKYKKTEGADSQTHKSSFYIVKKGDTLWSIAKKQNLSVTNLIELNSLKSNTLSIGQKLKLK